MMDKSKDKRNTHAPELRHLDMDMTDAASASDFTGLIPANPETETESEAYKKIHRFGSGAAKDISGRK